MQSVSSEIAAWVSLWWPEPPTADSKEPIPVCSTHIQWDLSVRLKVIPVFPTAPLCLSESTGVSLLHTIQTSLGRLAYHPDLAESRGPLRGTEGTKKGFKEAEDLPGTAKLCLAVCVMGREKVRREEDEEDSLTGKDTAEEERGGPEQGRKR